VTLSGEQDQTEVHFKVKKTTTMSKASLLSASSRACGAHAFWAPSHVLRRALGSEADHERLLPAQVVLA
jgi:hypothetical protein